LADFVVVHDVEGAVFQGRHDGGAGLWVHVAGFGLGDKENWPFSSAQSTLMRMSSKSPFIDGMRTYPEFETGLC
jgi:hypothetical protein